MSLSILPTVNTVARRLVWSVRLASFCCAGLFGCNAKLPCSETATCADGETTPAGGSGGNAAGPLGGRGNPAGGGAGTGIVGGGVLQGGAPNSATAGVGASGSFAGAQSTGTSIPCSGRCAGSRPVCDETANACVACLRDEQCTAPTAYCDVGLQQCVECTSSSHCSSAASICDSDTGKCVECLSSTACTDDTRAACLAGLCSPCSQDSDCNGHGERGLCAEGTCVQCTVENEAPCGDRSCDPVTSTCTGVARGTRNACETCQADSQCQGWDSTNSPSRCLPITFGGLVKGNYCLPIRPKDAACPIPFKQYDGSITSLSNVVVTSYCSPNQVNTSCPAVRDYINSVRCTSDTQCGCPRNANGDCTEPGQMGRCALKSGSIVYCTYTCGTILDCGSGQACELGSNNYCH